MQEQYIYAFGSVLLVSLVAIAGILPLLIKKKVPQKTLLLLVSLSAGTLFATVFLQLLPEAVSHGFTLGTALSVLGGILTLFVVEKFIHHRHSVKAEGHEKKLHGHAYHLAPLNIIGDGIHNFIDGIVIGASYLVSFPLGISATISILFHEIPQEIADFGVLLYSGLTRKKALLFNFLSAATAIVGTIVGIVATTKLAGFTSFILPFAAGNFLYIAGSNLVPELHKHCKIKESLLHLLMICIGIAIMVAITLLGPEHVHY